MVDFVERKEITTDEYDNFVRRFEEEEQELQEELSEMGKSDDAFLKTSLSVLELAQNAGKIFKKAEPEQKQRILNFIASNLLWDGENIALTLQEPFDILLDASKMKNWLDLATEVRTVLQTSEKFSIPVF